MRSWGKIVAAVLAAVVLCAPSEGQTLKSKKKAELLIPRVHRESVPSLEKSGKAIDTIDTANPSIKIVLYADNTWKYWRAPEDILQTKAFSEYWDTTVPNPYQVSLSDLPAKINIWVVDTLSNYRCPNRTKVYSKFGIRHRRRHQGVDLPLHTGDPVYAAFSGKVRLSRYMRGYGNVIIIRHENGLETFYAHLSKRIVDSDDWVNAGDIIGLGGSSGRSSGPHLHFETRYRGYAFDPQWLIDFETGTLRHRLFVLQKKHLDAGSKYVPESEDEEEDIYEGDTRDYAVADSVAAVKKAEEERAAAEAAKAVWHTVKSGDSLYGLARKNHTSVKAICALNPGLTEKSTLRIGKKIRIK